MDSKELQNLLLNEIISQATQSAGGLLPPAQAEALAELQKSGVLKELVTAAQTNTLGKTAKTIAERVATAKTATLVEHTLGNIGVRPEAIAKIDQLIKKNTVSPESLQRLLKLKISPEVINDMVGTLSGKQLSKFITDPKTLLALAAVEAVKKGEFRMDDLYNILLEDYNTKQIEKPLDLAFSDSESDVPEEGSVLDSESDAERTLSQLETLTQDQE
jgi:hypothetical protein